MKSPSPLKIASLLAALALIAGCESPSKMATPAAAPVETRTPVAAADVAGAKAGATAAATGTSQSGVATVDLANARSAAANAAAVAALAAPNQRVVYFDFDSFVIKDEYKGLLDAHAKLLLRVPAKQMVIEGHTDERGGREYNLALGQKRAEAVLKSFALLGVPDSQLEAVSFGEERPAASGSDESAWSRNRRAELKDR